MVVAFLSGFACMTIELTAVRLLAPSFGDSAYVWTNVIGVILLSLALGAYAGGRISEWHMGSPLAALLLIASALTALAPLIGPTLGGWLLPQELPLDAAMPALVRGSLVASAILFGPAVWLLGALSPGLVAAVVRRGKSVGSGVGGISAAGTIGSLLGTFAATHWLVPVLGCRATLWVAALSLLVAAVLLRRDVRALVVGLLVLLSLALHSGPLRNPPAGKMLIAERETRVQFLQVVRSPVGEGNVRTELKINEGLDSFHSVAVEGSVFSGGGYYDFHALVPYLAFDGERPAQLHALSIGDAAGTFRRVYNAVHPFATVDAVELDADAVQLGDLYFGGPRAPGEVIAPMDGRVFMSHAKSRWHVIHIDAYGHQVYIPGHLASVEFFRAVHDRLEPLGVVACNVGGQGVGDPVVTAIAGTMAQVFGSAAAMHIPNSRNVLLVARRDKKVDPTKLSLVQLGEERLSQQDRAAWSRVLEIAKAPFAWAQFGPAPVPLVDDCPELDRLLFASYLATPDFSVPTRMAGSEPVALAEKLTYAARENADQKAVLAAAGNSSSASAYLHLLCGDARWQLRQLHGAVADYEAGLATANCDAQTAQQLRLRLTSVREDLGPQVHAVRIGQRNGWLAGTALLLILILGYFTNRCCSPQRMSRMPADPSVSVSTAAR
jgi:hypothetical protein